MRKIQVLAALVFSLLACLNIYAYSSTNPSGSIHATPQSSGAATMTSPTPGSTFPGASVTFTWTTASGATEYILYLGTTPGAKDIASVNTGTATTTTVNNIPTTGATVYATLYSKIAGVLQSNAYTYTEFTGAPATMTSPTPGSTFSGASVTFSWTTGTNVTDYILYLGTTAGAKDIASVNAGTATSTTVNNIPTNGATVYATLYSKISGVLHSNAYTYTEFAGAPATMTSPTPGSTFSGASVTFSWTTGTNVTDYILYLGTTAGAKDIASVNAGTATSTTVNNIPTNGATVYATLYSKISGVLHSEAYTYTEFAGAPATMTSPTPGSTFSGASVTFSWTTGTNVTDYILYLGTTTGGKDIAAVNAGTATSTTINNIPTNGATVYATLFSKIAGVLHSNAYTYTENSGGTPATMTSPTPGSTFPGSSVTFTWTTGTGVTDYILYLGTTTGGNNIASIDAGTSTSTTVNNIPTTGATVYATLYSKIAGVLHSEAYTYTEYTGTSLSFGTEGTVGNGLINYPYAWTFGTASGGTPPYTYSVASGALPTGTTLSSTYPGLVVGTPTASGTFTFTLKVTDSASHTATSGSLAIEIVASSGANNSHLNGQYLCAFDGFLDSDNSQIATLASISANGSGSFSGEYDTNGRTVGPTTGSVSGSYALGSDNNGAITLTYSNGITSKYSMTANASGSVLQLSEIDDVLGTSQSGRHGSGTCQVSSSSAFTHTTIDGNKFVFVVHGENGSGVTRVAAGQLTATAGSSGGTLSGTQDIGQGDTGELDVSWTGSYTDPDSHGRLTFTDTAGGQTTANAAYILDANHIMMLRNDSGSGVHIGNIFKQQQSSYSAANLNGNFVIYLQDTEVDGTNSVQRYMSQIMQATGAGGSGSSANFTVNQNFENESGTYTVGDSVGAVTGTVASNGRVVLNVGASLILYVYDNNSAVLVQAGGLSGGSGLYNNDFGFIEPQTLTTFTDSAIAGTYAGGPFPIIEPDATVTLNNESQVASSGDITGFEDEGAVDFMAYDEPYGTTTYAFNPTPSYGVFIIYDNKGNPNLSCAAIAATRSVCIYQNDSSPTITLEQQ